MKRSTTINPASGVNTLTKTVAILTAALCCQPDAALSAETIIATTPVAATLQTAAAGNTSGNLLQVIGSLVLVLALVFFASCAIKKFGLRTLSPELPIRVIGSVSIGSNQRIMVIEAGESWIVLGVSPQQITTITTLPRQESSSASKPNFSAWLQQTIEKRHVKEP